MENQSQDTERIRITDEDKQRYLNETELDQINPKKFNILREWKERKIFFENIIEELIVVDPLDRCGDPEKYPAMDHDKALTVE